MKQGFLQWLYCQRECILELLFPSQSIIFAILFAQWCSSHGNASAHHNWWLKRSLTPILNTVLYMPLQRSQWNWKILLFSVQWICTSCLYWILFLQNKNVHTSIYTKEVVFCLQRDKTELYNSALTANATIHSLIVLIEWSCTFARHRQSL